MTTGFFLTTKLLFRLSLILQSQQYSTAFSLLVFQGTAFIHCATWAFMPSGVWLSSDNCKNKKIKGCTDKFVFLPQPYYFSNMSQTAQTSALVLRGLFPFTPANTKLWVCGENDFTLTVIVHASVSPLFISATLFTSTYKYSWLNPSSKMKLECAFWYLNTSILLFLFFHFCSIFFYHILCLFSEKKNEWRPEFLF